MSTRSAEPSTDERDTADSGLTTVAESEVHTETETSVGVADGAPEWGKQQRRPDGVSESILVRAHPGLCEAWGQCHKWAPDVYPLDKEGYIDIHVLEVPPELAQMAFDGARSCPIGVISIVDIVVRPEHEHLRPAASEHPEK